MAEVIMDESQNKMQVDSTQGAAHSKLFGITSTGTLLPIKVTDDGSGLGKLVTAIE